MEGFEERSEITLNYERVNWIKEHAPGSDRISGKAKMAISQLQYLPETERLLFTERRLGSAPRYGTLVETVIDGKETVMEDFYLRYLTSPYSGGTAIWVNPFLRRASIRAN